MSERRKPESKTNDRPSTAGTDAGAYQSGSGVPGAGTPGGGGAAGGVGGAGTGGGSAAGGLGGTSTGGPTGTGNLGGGGGAAGDPSTGIEPAGAAGQPSRKDAVETPGAGSGLGVSDTAREGQPSDQHERDDQ